MTASLFDCPPEVEVAPQPLVSGRKRPMPEFNDEDDEEDDENLDDFNFDLIPLVLPPPATSALRQSEDWVPGVGRGLFEEISRNRESLSKLFDDSQPISPIQPPPRVPVVASARTQPPLTARRATKILESTEDRILREAAEARRSLHERIAQSARMAAKFTKQNEIRKNRLARN